MHSGIVQTQSRNMPERQPLGVVFRVTCSETEFGQVLVVTGQSARLGSWNPLQGLYLSTNEEDFPMWKSEKIMVDELAVGIENLKLDYKYVIVS